MKTLAERIEMCQFKSGNHAINEGDAVVCPYIQYMKLGETYCYYADYDANIKKTLCQAREQPTIILE